jgi:hypothetical protein
MRTESNGRRGMTASDIAARVIELAPGLLQGLAPGDLANILQAGTLRRIPARSIIANEREPAAELFLILHGHARTFTITPKGEKVLLLANSSGRSLWRKSVVGHAYAIPGEHRGGDGVHCTSVGP